MESNTISLLEKLVDTNMTLVTRSRPRFTQLIGANLASSVSRIVYSPAIVLDETKQYELGLKYLATYYGFPNIITGVNDSFTYWTTTPPDLPSWKTIVLPQGSYELSKINEAIQLQMKLNGDYDSINDTYNVVIGGNESTFHSTLTIRNSYKVDFTSPTSLASTLGFNNQIYTADYQESENEVNILNVTTIHLNVSIIKGSYHNGSVSQTLFSFFPDVSPGFKIVKDVVNPTYLRTNDTLITEILYTITDQNGTPLDNGDNTYDISLELREM